MRFGRSVRAGVAGVLLVLAALAALAEPMEIRARVIENFRIGRDTMRFGQLEFVGGLEMTSGTRDFGALSSFRFLDGGRRFMGVADTGFFFFGEMTRDGEGRPAGVADFSMQPMVDRAGRTITGKWGVDAEGVAVRGDRVFVSFERNHRVSAYALEPGAMAGPERDIPILIPKRELRQNRSLEALAASPESGPLGGSLVVVAEKSVDRAGNLFAAVLEGPRKGIFSVMRQDPFDVTDGAFLPNGDLLLLERRYSIASGVGMRLRRIPGEAIRPGAVVDGPVLLEADMGYQIDNMEALDVWTRADGETMVSLMSDDNHSILQRNLYLEFRLGE